MLRLAFVAVAFGPILLPANPARGEAPLLPRPRAASRWYVYSDAGAKGNRGEWTNFMPKEAGKMIRLSLVEKDRPFAGSTCIRVDVQWLNPFWCGVAVSCLPDYWGETPAPAFDLRRARKLVFHARGARSGECIQVKVAIAGDKKFGDSALLPAATKWISLTDRWRRYELDLSGVNLARVVTPFCFVTSRDYNRANITFYLDEIYFELAGR